MNLSVSHVAVGKFWLSLQFSVGSFVYSQHFSRLYSFLFQSFSCTFAAFAWDHHPVAQPNFNQALAVEHRYI